MVRKPQSGFTLVEVLVATSLLTIAVVGIAAVGLTAIRQLQFGKADDGVRAAVQFQMEKITALGYDNLVAGADTVDGYPLAWSVTSSSPKKIILTIENKKRDGTAATDTFVNYVADWGP